MVKEKNKSFLKKYYVEIIIFLLAIILRYLGLVPGFPPIHPDEGTSYSTAIYMLEHSYRPDRFDYPAGMALTHAIIYRTIFLPVQLFRLFIAQPEMFFAYLKLDEQMVHKSHEFLFGNRQVYAMFWSRYIAATFGWSTVVLLYFIVRRLFGRPAAIFSAGLLAVNYRHVLGSHFGLPDVHGGFIGLLALLAAVMLVEKKTMWRYVFVGITAGLYFSLKYQPFAFVPLLLAHLYWAFKEKNIKNIIHPYAFLALGVAIFTFVAINPYYFSNMQNAFFRNDQDYRRYQMGVIELRLYGYFYLFHWGIGELASAAVIVGALAMAIKQFVPFLLISSFSISILIFMTILSIGAIYTRNLVAPMPYFMIFAGYALSLLYGVFRYFNLMYKELIIAVLVLVIGFKPAYNSLMLSMNYAKPWNTGVLEQWLASTLPEDVNLRSYQLFLGSKGVNTLKRKHVKFLEWDYSGGPNSLAEFQELGDDFAILQLSNLQSITYWWRQFPKNSMFLQYSDVPYDYITNSFFGLTVRELLPYTVAEIYKPWQALEETNYLIFKIPKMAVAIGDPIAQFSFDSLDKTEWKALDLYGLGGFIFKRNEENGYNALGSLLIEGSGHSTSRISSPSFPVVAGREYLVRGWMKEDGDKTATHDGYLRLDFYKNQEDFQREKMSLGVGISSRVYPNSAWEKKEFSVIAPIGARFAAISFQRFSSQNKFSTYLDDIEIFEAQRNVEELFPQVPYIKPTIQLRDIFYHGFL